VISLPQAAGGGTRLVDRTNNVLEDFFHGLKHAERRRSGRKILTQDLENLPATATLARNLLRPDYVAVLSGSLDELARASARLDASAREQARLVTKDNDKQKDERREGQARKAASIKLPITSAGSDRLHAQRRPRYRPL
jgi:hypothetical protein